MLKDAVHDGEEFWLGAEIVLEGDVAGRSGGVLDVGPAGGMLAMEEEFRLGEAEEPDGLFDVAGGEKGCRGR